MSAEHGYHGHVGFALAMDEERYSQWFPPLVPGVTKVRSATSRAVGPRLGHLAVTLEGEQPRQVVQLVDRLASLHRRERARADHPATHRADAPALGPRSSRKGTFGPNARSGS